MKKITFITSNKFKLQEIGAILKDYGVELEQKKIDYPEDKEDDMEQVVIKAAKNLANELKKPVMVEDTGLYFKAYNNFPGALPKFVINGIGFDGIFRLLEGKDRTVTFKTYIGFCKPGEEPVTFNAEMNGEIIDKVIDPDTDTMPYNHIFKPEGQEKVVAQLSLEEFNAISHRAKASHKLGKYLKENL